MSRIKLVYTCALLALLFNLVMFPYTSTRADGRKLIIEPWMSWQSPDWFRFFLWMAIIAIVTTIARMLVGRGRRGEVAHGRVLPMNR